MAFPKEHLNDDEEVILHRNPHWTFMIGPIAFVLIAVALAIFVSVIIPPPIGLIGFAAVIMAVLAAGVQFLRWQSIEFVVTTDRIITRVGILSKHGTEIPLDRVMNISYSQSLQERMFGVGDLVIESAGENGRQFFSDVSAPAQVQNTIYRQVEIYTQKGPNNGLGDDTGGGGGSRDSIPEQIEQLDRLRQQGIVTDDEFREKKRQLLDRL